MATNMITQTELDFDLAAEEYLNPATHNFNTDSIEPVVEELVIDFTE